jgi:hypothetical protein
LTELGDEKFIVEIGDVIEAVWRGQSDGESRNRKKKKMHWERGWFCNEMDKVKNVRWDHLQLQ